jgi:hypothetical protein
MVYPTGHPRFDGHNYLILAHGKNWDDDIDLFPKFNICYYVRIGGNDKEISTDWGVKDSRCIKFNADGIAPAL